MNIALAILTIIILSYPISTTDIQPRGILEYWQQQRQVQLKDHAKKLYIINANINYLQ
jgi:hypothetical protein